MLAKPGQIQKSHSTRLAGLMRDRLDEQGGWMSFEQYMEMALYQPGLGYYAAGSRKFGADGDFVTAPMLGNLFATCVAAQCLEVMETIEGMESPEIVEFGAGTGVFCLDLLQHLEREDRLPTRYQIIETSGELQQRQYRVLELNRPDLLHLVDWTASISPRSINGIVIANEVLDAMPVLRVHTDANGELMERGVGWSEGNFHWHSESRPVSQEVQLKLDKYSIPQEYETEVGRIADGWVLSIAERINAGVMLIIDYGFPGFEYYHPDRNQGTLMCHYRHTAHGDPFFCPGLQDITAHVDFSSVAEAARSTGMSIAGYCNQEAFLLSLGLLDFLEKSRSVAQSTAEELSLTQQVKKLILPHEMGELFKVLALSRNYPEELSGFAMQNRRGSL